ncbi:MAG: thymidylate kinase [Thermoplasmata archaeon]|nr:thymidylate kinase [Thermoplasmata archaeon]
MKRLIAVDGLDGCGKDSHASAIQRLLEERGEEVVLLTHPSTRIIGRLSKRFLQQTGTVPRFLATVFFTLDVLASVSRYKRQRHGTFIFVRYLLGAAYLPPRLAGRGYVFFKKLLPFPDLPLFIDIQPEKAIRRIDERDHRREMFETLSKLREIRLVTLRIIDDDWRVVDNTEDGDGPFMVTERIVLESLRL